jgi:UDP-glucuronate 4-epimerase
MDVRSASSAPIVVTGSAGFIGFHVARRLLEQHHRVVGIDGFTDYYDVTLKRARHAILSEMPGFDARAFMLEDADAIRRVLLEVQPKIVVHLAAQAGVRYSLDNPRAYIDSNIVGTFNVLDACREVPPDHLVMASTSSVYGDGEVVPFSENSETSRPVSLYAATKKATEVIAHSYAHLHGLPVTALRFFTVYGPWGRPDMALFKFTDAILHDREIEIYGEGRMSRDFTYIADLVDGIVALLNLPPAAERSAPFRAINIGASQPVKLTEFVSAIETVLGKKARKKLLPMQPGDVRQTWADVGELRHLVPGLKPRALPDGVRAFVDWYRDYYSVPAAALP